MSNEFQEILDYLESGKSKKYSGWEQEWEIAIHIGINFAHIVNKICLDILNGITEKIKELLSPEWIVELGIQDNEGNFVPLSPDKIGVNEHFSILLCRQSWDEKGLYIALENESNGPNNWFFGLRKRKRKEETKEQKVMDPEIFKEKVLEKLKCFGYILPAKVEDNEWWYAWKYANNQNYQYRRWRTEEFLINAIKNQDAVINTFKDELVKIKEEIFDNILSIKEEL
ncbi:MAG: hypothetical protein HPY74_08170 [Firmicutes bacterium]|nr:hypothetical protein [Bacillota bacterium]